MFFKRYVSGFINVFEAFDVVFTKPSLFLYFIIPFIISMIVLVLLIFFGVTSLIDFIPGLVTIDDKDGFLYQLFYVLISVIFVLMVIFMAGYSFIAIVKIFCAPFNDLLSEKIEIMKNEHYKEPENAWQHFIKNLFPTILEELKKITVFLTGYLVIVLLSFLPFINFISPFLLVIYSAIVLSIDFVDYSMARRRMTLKAKIQFFKANKAEMLGFGTSVFLMFSIPIVNIFFIQIAVIAATLLYIKKEEIEKSIET
jgi:CysZ protein